MKMTIFDISSHKRLAPDSNEAKDDTTVTNDLQLYSQDVACKVKLASQSSMAKLQYLEQLAIDNSFFERYRESCTVDNVNGDQELLTKLVDAWTPAAKAKIYRFKLSPDVEEDLLQEAFIKLIEKADVVKTNPKGYFIKTVFRMTFGYFRSEKHRRSVSNFSNDDMDFLASKPDMRNASPLNASISNEQVVIVRESLARLGEMDRETLVHFMSADKVIADGMDKFDVVKGTMKRRINVAKQRLRDDLEYRLGQDESLDL